MLKRRTRQSAGSPAKQPLWTGLIAVALVVQWAGTSEAEPFWAGPESAADKSDDPQAEWAYRPIDRPEVPLEDLQDGPIHNSIDAFIARKLKREDLQPAREADKRTLIRRLYLDLTGLPPRPVEIERFLQDDSTNAYAKLVDRLLGSPHYGEQQARHWLDVVRYADTAGFANDFERPNAWRYRDYVIRSFNEDKPYDRFLREQIAGDELNPNDPEMLIAVGFLRMGPWEHTGMSVAAVTRQQYLDDVTHQIGVTVLGQGLRCSKCHDHKFDPITQQDYYSLQAVFAPVQFADRKVSFLPEENTTDFTLRRRRYQRLLKETRETIRRIDKKHKQAVRNYLERKGVDRIAQLPDEEQPKRHFGLTTKQMGLKKICRKRIAYYRRALQRFEPYAFSVYNGPPRRYRSNTLLHPMPEKRKGAVPEVHLLHGGSLKSPGKKVEPAVLKAPQTSMPSEQSAIPASLHGRRLALARWLTDPENPLTARVIVNRIWQHHFAGHGLVRTPNNFGDLGARPTHPELLDWLARWFTDHDWSMKKLHRLIVTSATYRRASRHRQSRHVQKVDPKNKWLAYYPARRLAAEEIRDSMLAVSGELNPEMGGPGIRPEINRQVALQPRHIMGTVAPAYQPSPKRAQRHRRTIYAFRRRSLANPLLKVFNRPHSTDSCPRRDETTVPTQVFSLLNGAFVHDRALAMAHRLVQEAETPKSRLQRAFRLIYSRRPTPGEQKQCLKHVGEMLAHHRNHKPPRTELPEVVTREMIEELTGEPFQWQEELDVYAEGYQRDLKPWQVKAETRAWAELCLVLLNSNEFLYVE